MEFLNRPHDTLTACLAAAAARLESGDLVAASESIDAVVAACQACEASGVALGRDALQTAQDLFARCTALATQAEADLHARNLQAGVLGHARKRYSET